MLELVNLAKIAADGKRGPDDAVDDDDFLDVSPCWKRETLDNVKLGDELSVKKRAQAQRLIEEFSPVFTDMSGEMDLIKHRVKLSLDEPMRSRRYLVSNSVRETLRKELNDMLKMNII